MACTENTDQFELLRSKIQELAKQQPDNDLSMQQYEEISKLIHQLEVHQQMLGVKNLEALRREQELASLHRKYEDLYEFASCGCLTLNAKEKIIEANSAATRILETDRDILKRLNLKSFIERSWHDAYRSTLEQAELTGEIHSLELPLKSRAGKSVWVRANVQAVSDDSGGEARYWVALDDITQRKQAEEALKRREKRFAKIFHRNPSFMLITDFEDGTILEVNEAYCRLTGFNRQELIGRTALGLGIFSEEDNRQGIKLLKEHGAISSREERRWSKDGRMKHVLLSAELTQLGDRWCIISMGLDITGRKHAEQALQLQKPR